MPKAEKAIGTAPGVLAVKVVYETSLATVGTEEGTTISTEEMMEALEPLGYKATLVDPP